MARIGLGQAWLLPFLDQRGHGTAVIPLYYANSISQLSLSARPEQKGLVLDPTTHLRELPSDDRAEAFRNLPYGGDRDPFDAETAELGDDAILELALTPPALEREGGASLVLTTYHLAGGVGTRGRDLELLLARLAVQDFRDQRHDEPPVLSPHQFSREIYATIAVPLEVLRDFGEARRLAEAYLDIPADGYWVKILGFDERARLADIAAAGHFFRCLREGRRPIVTCGAGQLYLGCLCDGLSASIGIAEGERFRYPERWRVDANGESFGRRRPVYHPRLLRSIMTGNRRLAAAFAAHPCDCGHHARHEPPIGRNRDAHAALSRIGEINDAIEGDTADRREWLMARADIAADLARDLGLERRPLVGRYQALLDGLDGVNERLSLARAG